MGKSTINGNFNSFLYVYQRVSVGIGEEPRCFKVQTFPTPWRTGSQAGGPEFHTKIVGLKTPIKIYIYIYLYYSG